LLHAARLEFAHPLSGEMLRIDARVDREFASVLAARGWGHATIAFEEDVRCRLPQ